MGHRAQGTGHRAQGENDCKTAGLKAQGRGKVMQVLQAEE